MEYLVNQNSDIITVKGVRGYFDATTNLGKALAILRRYEGTDMTPEEIKAIIAASGDSEKAKRVIELAEADADNRVVVLPCRITDTVYLVEDVYEKRKKVGERIVSALIDHATIGGENGHLTFELCSETGGWYCSMEPDDFYLTREEAERAAGGKGATP